MLKERNVDHEIAELQKKIRETPALPVKLLPGDLLFMRFGESGYVSDGITELPYGGLDLPDDSVR